MSLDDCILVNNSDEPDSCEGAYIARVVDLFDIGKCWQILTCLTLQTQFVYFTSSILETFCKTLFSVQYDMCVLLCTFEHVILSVKVIKC